jgi:hypothetical protein
VADDSVDRILDELLDELYHGQERVTQAEIYRRAIAADLPPEALSRIDAMPYGEYAIDEAAEVLHEGVPRRGLAGRGGEE